MSTLNEIIAGIIEARARPQQVNRSALLAQYPEHAEPLRRFFDDFELIGHVVGAPYEAASGATAAAPGANHGEQVSGFRIVKELHRGAQGIVYEAVQLSTHRLVALKMLYRSGTSPFANEARIIASLTHPNVVTVFDAGFSNGRPFYAMELIDGLPLDVYMSRHPMNRAHKLRLYSKICAGVAHAHARGVIHRDLKPSNILVDAHGEPRVLDFGLATTLTMLTADGEVMHEFVGTLAYSAPEQIAGLDENVDERADVYSLGIILYQLITGVRPYPVPDTLRGTLAVIMHRTLDPPSLVTPDCDACTDEIVVRAMAKSAANRYPSVESLRSEVLKCILAQPVAP
jgi:serine/threonine protein kinase